MRDGEYAPGVWRRPQTSYQANAFATSTLMPVRLSDPVPDLEHPAAASCGGMAAVTTNPESFAGTFDNPPNTGDGSGRYDFTGTDLISTPSPFAP